MVGSGAKDGRRVLFVSLSHQIGGAERSLLTVAPRLEQLGWRGVVAAPPGPFARESLAVGLGVRLVRWFEVPAVSESQGSHKRYPARRLLHSAAASAFNAALLALVARRTNAEIVVSNSFAAHPFVVYGAKASGLPSIVYLRDIVGPGRGRRVLERCGRSSGTVIAISQAVADTVPGASPVIVTNPVAPPLVSAGGRPRDSAPHRVGFIGRLDPGKGLEALIGAAHEVEATFVVAGERHTGPAEYEEKIRRLAAAVPDGRVRLIGRVPDAGVVLGEVDVLVVPSEMEPWGRVAAEALLAGVPVIAASSGGLPEIIEDGYNGLLFDPGSASRLAERLRYLLARPDLRRRFGDAGRASKARFSPDTSARRLAEILDAASSR